MSFNVWLCALYRLKKTLWLSPRKEYLYSLPSHIAHSRLPRSVDLFEQRTMRTVAPMSHVDTSALTISLNVGESTQSHAKIGDKASIGLDVDDYQVDLSDDQKLTVDINALQPDEMISTLSSCDNCIHVFSLDGTQRVFNTPVTRTYSISVSGTANTAYGPNIDNSEASKSTDQCYSQTSAGASPAASVLRLNILSTTNAVISGLIASDLGLYMSSVEFELNRDEVVDEYATADGIHCFSNSASSILNYPLVLENIICVY